MPQVNEPGWLKRKRNKKREWDRPLPTNQKERRGGDKPKRDRPGRKGKTDRR